MTTLLLRPHLFICWSAHSCSGRVLWGHQSELPNHELLTARARASLVPCSNRLEIILGASLHAAKYLLSESVNVCCARMSPRNGHESTTHNELAQILSKNTCQYRGYVQLPKSLSTIFSRLSHSFVDSHDAKLTPESHPNPDHPSPACPLASQGKIAQNDSFSLTILPSHDPPALVYP